MRGAHRCVWCSKSTPLIEAEFFAAERCRPAPSGRALLCAANHARKIQGLTASQNLPDARNRAPAPPFRCTSPMCQRKGGFGGVKRGQGNHMGALAPFCLRRQTAEGLPSAEGKEEKEAGIHSHFSQTSGQYPTVACLPFRTTGVFISVPSSSSFSFLSSS